VKSKKGIKSSVFFFVVGMLRLTVYTQREDRKFKKLKKVDA